MSIWSLSELDEQIAAFKKGMLALASAQTVTIGDTTYTRAELPNITKTLDYLSAQREALTGGAGPRVVTARPRR